MKFVKMMSAVVCLLLVWGCAESPLLLPPPTTVPAAQRSDRETGGATIVAPPAETATPLEMSAPLRAALTVAGMEQHLAQFRAIAAAQGDNRAAGTDGYHASAAYVAEQLTAAGYDVTLQPFTFDGFVQLAPPELVVIAPEPMAFAATDLGVVAYSGSGVVTGTVQAVDIIAPADVPPNSSTSGCEATDFVQFQAGNIALLQRGVCPFRVKVQNAADAGAAGVIIFNEGQPGRTDLFGGTLRDALAPDLPVLSASYGVGQQLLDAQARAGAVTARLDVSTKRGEIETVNVLAETRGGDSDHVIMAGGHLDSVAAGPGINDNGSGTAALLEIALQLAALEIQPVHKVRFAFWSAEELGLLGSAHYVTDLSENDPDALARIALYLNFDMIASPNYMRAVYSLGASAPTGSQEIEVAFTDYFDAHDLYWETVSIAGRSDHGPFLLAGIPAGGLFSGAEGLMSAEQALHYSHAQVGEPHDPCYHLACDTLANVNATALDELGDAAAHVLLLYALDETLSARWAR